MVASKRYIFAFSISLILGVILCICGGLSANHDRPSLVKLGFYGQKHWVHWYKDYGYIDALQVDQQGNIFLLHDGIITKYEPNGEIIWSKSFEGINDMKIGQDGNIYMILHDCKTDKNCNVKTIALDQTGDVLWERWYEDMRGHQLFLDNSGNVIVIGSEVPRDHIYKILKYNPSGDLCWSTTYRFTDDYENDSVHVDSDGNILIINENLEWIEREPISTCMTVKYDPDGELLWEAEFVYGEKSTGGKQVIADKEGNVYIISECKFFTGNCLVKYKNNGEQLWVKYLAVDSFSSIYMALDKKGYPVVSGEFSESLDGIYYLNTIKYNPEGDVIWESQFEDPSRMGWLDVYHIVIDRFNNVYIMGAYCQGYLHEICENKRFMIIKYDPDGNQEWVSYQDDRMPSSFSPVQNEEGSIYAAYPVELALSPELQWDDDEEADDDTPFIAPGHDGDDACGCGC